MKKYIIMLVMMLLSIAAFSQYSVKYDTVRFKRGGNIYRLRIVGDTLFLNSDTIYLASSISYIEVCDTATPPNCDTVYITDEDIWVRDTLNHKVFLRYINDNVGIGTSVPTKKLDVVGNGRISTQLYLPGIDSTSDYDSLIGWKSSNGQVVAIPNHFADTCYDNPLCDSVEWGLWRRNTLTQTLYPKDTTDYVSIGVGYRKGNNRLYVRGNVYADRYQARIGVNLGDTTIGYGDRSITNLGGGIGLVSNYSGSGTPYATKWTHKTTEIARMDTTGKLGLRITPRAVLDVKGDVYLSYVGQAASFDSVYVKDGSTGKIKTSSRRSIGYADSTYVRSGTSINVDSSGNTYTINNTAPDRTVTIAGGGIVSVSSSYPSFTITGTEVDGSITNELQTLSSSGTSTPSITLSASGGTVTLTSTNGVNLSHSAGTINISVDTAGGRIIMPEGLNSVMGIDSTTEHQYVGYATVASIIDENNPGFSVYNESYTPGFMGIRNNSKATTDQALVGLWGSGHNGVFSSVDTVRFQNGRILRIDSLFGLGVRRVRVEGFASQDWSATAGGTYLKFSTTHNDSTTVRERMRIDHNGNVGIGTTPSSKLDVTGDVEFNTVGQSSGFDSAYVKDTSTGKVKTIHKNSMGFLDGDSTAWYHNEARGVTYLRHDGDSVGIGTITPEKLLHVDGTAKIHDSIWVGDYNWITEIEDLNGLKTNQMWQSRQLNVVGNKTSSDLSWIYNDINYLGGTYDSGIVISPKGNMALGTLTAQSQKLYVGGTTKITGATYLTGITTASTEDSLVAWKPSTGELIAIPRSAYPTDTSAWVHNASRSTTYLRNINDVVSIGETVTDNVNRKLHVEGSTSIKDTLYFGEDGDAIWSVPSMSLFTNRDWHVDGTAYSVSLDVNSAKGAGNIASFTNDITGVDSTVVIDSKARIGVGKAPTESVDVNGTVKATGFKATGLTNDGSPDTVVTVANGQFYRSAISSVNVYRYSAYSSGATKVEVLASGTGITAAFSAPTQLDFTIPSGVRLISVKVNITGVSTLTCDMGTSDMGNSSLLDRWMPIVQVWREDTGAEQTGVTTTLITGTHDQFRINGLNNAAGMHIRLSF